MSDYKERLIKEKEELSDKLDKLQQFIFANEKFSELDATNRALLIAQSDAMNSYENILEMRINGVPDLIDSSVDIEFTPEFGVD